MSKVGSWRWVNVSHRSFLQGFEATISAARLGFLSGPMEHQELKDLATSCGLPPEVTSHLIREGITSPKIFVSRFTRDPRRATSAELHRNHAVNSDEFV